MLSPEGKPPSIGTEGDRITGIISSIVRPGCLALLKHNDTMASAQCPHPAVGGADREVGDFAIRQFIGPGSGKGFGRSAGPWDFADAVSCVKLRGFPVRGKEHLART